MRVRPQKTWLHSHSSYYRYENVDKINDAFKQLVNVVGALGISDERIIEEQSTVNKLF